MLHSLKKMFKSNYLFTFGVIICLFWIIMAIIAPFVAPYDPVVQDLTLRLKAPSAAHIFGTDNFGIADSRLCHIQIFCSLCDAFHAAYFSENAQML